MTNRILLGSIAALSAAALNGSVGLFSKYLIGTGLPASSIAFYKTSFAFVIMTLIVLLTGDWQELRLFMRKKYKQLAVAAFLGVFVLYFFETAAYSYEKISVVAFVLLGSSTLATFILLSILEKKMISFGNLISIALALSGLGIMFLESMGRVDVMGSLCAMIAGIGYGCFLVVTKIFKLGSGLKTIWALMLFASLFLGLPLVGEGVARLTSLAQVGVLLLSALIPTILGFWCTTKSLELIASSRVQLLELTEPLFAMVFAAIFIGEWISSNELSGGGLIILSIVCFEKLGHLSFPWRRREKSAGSTLESHLKGPESAPQL